MRVFGDCKFSEFALFWNQDLDAVVRRGKDRGATLRQHAEMICNALLPILSRRELAPDMLLPPGSEEQTNAGFTGTLGAFQIYRGAKRGHRMANLRLILR